VSPVFFIILYYMHDFIVIIIIDNNILLNTEFLPVLVKAVGKLKYCSSACIPFTTCPLLNINTRALPAAVRAHVNNVPKAACDSGDKSSFIFQPIQRAPNNDKLCKQ